MRCLPVCLLLLLAPAAATPAAEITGLRLDLGGSAAAGEFAIDFIRDK